MASDLREVPLLAHTHGQPATPTTMGKELAVLAWRLQRQLARIEDADFLGKLNGATGTYGAHVAAVPDADWQAISREFVEHLGLTWNPLTTQIESHDWQSELYADIARFNRVLHNMCTDVWTYISLGYFAQVRGQGTVGSSTMPHKVNPIRFENAEANLEVSNALLDVLAATLVQSRLQRDLTDSSMQRNIGSAFGHSLLAIDNATRGLDGLDAVPAAMAADLDANWEVLGEPIQSAMRALGARGVPGMDEPYERLKQLTRGRRIGQVDLVEFVRGLGLPADVEERLAAMTPQTYVGLAPAWSTTWTSRRPAGEQKKRARRSDDDRALRGAEGDRHEPWSAVRADEGEVQRLGLVARRHPEPLAHPARAARDLQRADRHVGVGVLGGVAAGGVPLDVERQLRVGNEPLDADLLPAQLLPVGGMPVAVRRPAAHSSLGGRDVVNPDDPAEPAAAGFRAGPDGLSERRPVGRRVVEDLDDLDVAPSRQGQDDVARAEPGVDPSVDGVDTDQLGQSFRSGAQAIVLRCIRDVVKTHTVHRGTGSQMPLTTPNFWAQGLIGATA